MDIKDLKNKIRHATKPKEDKVEPKIRAWDINNNSINTNEEFNGKTVVLIDDVIDFIHYCEEN